MLLCLAPVLAGAAQQPNSPDQSTTATTIVSFQEASQNLIKRVDPVYPPLAKGARVQGTVRFEVTITISGTVTDIKLVSGHPLLVQAAKDSIKQWEFKPFLRDGQPVSVRAALEVPFSLGDPTAADKQEQAISQDYGKNYDECQAANKDRKSVV